MIGFISVFFIGLGGIIFGHVALSQIKRTGEGGRGLALAATIIGYVRVAFVLLGALLFFVFFGVFASAASNGSWSSSTDPFDDDFGSSYEEPWIGTPQEGFCTALEDRDAYADDERDYFETLRKENTDAEFTKLIEQQLASIDLDYDALSEADAIRLEAEQRAWEEAFWAKSDSCWAL